MANELSKATGRRKTAVAHVRLISGTGKWTVNGVDVERYIPSESLRAYINQPFAMTDLAGKYDVLVSAFDYDSLSGTATVTANVL